MNKEEVIEIANNNNGYLYSKIVNKHKIPTAYITKLIREEKLEKVAKGVYITSKGLEDLYFINAVKYSKIVYSGESALFLNNISNKQFVENEVVIPYGSTAPKIDNYKVRVSRKDSFNLGIIEIKTPFNNVVKSYDKERCICDLFLRPDYYDFEERIYAINEYKKNYLNIKKLYKYAKELKVYDEVKNVFEVIGWN